MTIPMSPLVPRVDRVDTKSASSRAQTWFLAVGSMPSDDCLCLFVVERRLPAITERGLAMLQAALTEASRRFAARGESIVYLQSTFIPRQERLLSLFVGESLELVRAA